eukprot:ctg_299.g160
MRSGPRDAHLTITPVRVPVIVTWTFAAKPCCSPARNFLVNSVSNPPLGPLPKANTIRWHSANVDVAIQCAGHGQWQAAAAARSRLSAGAAVGATAAAEQPSAQRTVAVAAAGHLAPRPVLHRLLATVESVRGAAL